MAAVRVGRIKLGSQGLEVSAQGLGCINMSVFYAYPNPNPEEDMIALIHHAVHSGVTFLDTADVFDPLNNETVLEKHRVDTRIPIEVTNIGEVKKLVEEVVQVVWSLWSRDVEEEIIPTCRELGIGIVAYSPLGRGFFSSGPKVAENPSNNDYRKVKFRVTDASLTQFNFSIADNTHHYNLALNISVRNPNKRIGIYYDSIEANAYYQGQRFDIETSAPGAQEHDRSQPRLQGAAITPAGRHQGRVGSRSWLECKIAVDGGKEGFAIVVDSVEGVVGERRRSFVDKLQVEELHGLSLRELEKCNEGAGVFWRPLGQGFFSSGHKFVENFSKDDFRKVCKSTATVELQTEVYDVLSNPLCSIMLMYVFTACLQFQPRFQPENLEHNKIIFERVNEMATNKGCTPSQLALAWVHHQGDDVCPIPGTTKIKNFNDNIGALSVKLTPEEMVELESFASEDAVKGDRYPNEIQTWKTSETPPLSSWKAE
ncbi:hypothetical protein FH972_008691 [Carpinus fangiana]|uniref:NADP-dependent oxidoreductase domain-containing protein n=1 Tax=Carpinus fangiana TaxID=176857 RepID=A0A5N6R1R9_9ROSI|nr:hypothetical protein FH972_008691 [Carpinus fangiana]